MFTSSFYYHFFTLSNIILSNNFRTKISTRRYQCIEDLESDLNLMFDNCDLYNEQDSRIGREAARLRKLLKALMIKIRKQ